MHCAQALNCVAWRMRFLALGLLSLFALLGDLSAAVRTKVDLVNLTPDVRAGEKALVALRYRCDPHFHIYWKNPGDAGAPPTVEWTEKSGTEVGGFIWPGPKLLDQAAREIAHGHQERWDGSGYPLGLAGERIPLSARVMAIADAYDALTSDRVYRAGVAHDKAVQLIFQERAAQFDPDMVDAFIEIQDEFAAIATRYADTDSDLQQKIDYMAKAIAEMGLKGVYQRKEYKRQYPEGEAAAHVVGFTNVEDIGQEGVELTFEKELAGRGDAVALEYLDQVVEDFPVAGVGVVQYLIVPRQLTRLNELDVAGAARQDLFAVHRGQAGVARASDVVGVAELTHAVAILSIPGDRKA